MKDSIKSGLAIAAFGIAMAHPSAASAGDPPAASCGPENYGAIETVVEVAPEGTYRYDYGCTEFGWLLFGTTFCDNEGFCSSD